MLKNRAFMMGLGAGIIIGALLLELMYIGDKSGSKLAQIGNDSVSEEKLYTQAEVDALLAAQQDSADIKEDLASPAASKKPAGQDEATPEPVEADEPSATAKSEGTIIQKPDASPDAEQTGTQMVLRIEPGFNLSETAALLEESGVISDGTAFINQMKKSDKRVRAGYFLFYENISVEEAIKTVTGKPITKEEAAAFENGQAAH